MASDAVSPPPPQKKPSGDELSGLNPKRPVSLAVSGERGASPAPPSRIVIVPTKTPREGDSSEEVRSNDRLQPQGSTISGIRVSKEEPKSKSLFQKIETKLGLSDDKVEKKGDGKAAKDEKKTSRRPRSERDNITISRPTSMVHKTHVDREFQWTGENADKAFQLEQKIGGGAYGSVYKATHKETGFTLAIKVVQVSRAEQDELKKEVDILKKCKEFNIVHYYGTCAKDDALWILMDYCSVGSVLDLIRTIRRTLSEEEIAVILLSVLKGLSYLHREGIIHRDLKSANILLNESMEPKIADFGVSAQIGTLISSKAKTVVGTPLFMSPEVLDGASHDSKTDIWSVGIMCIELAEGQPPYSQEHVGRAMKLICTEAPPKLKDTGKYNTLFHTFIDLCLQKEPEKRPSAVELLTHPFITWIINSSASDLVPKRLAHEYEKHRRMDQIKMNLEERMADNRSPVRVREQDAVPHKPLEQSPEKIGPAPHLPEFEERVPSNELPLEYVDEHLPATQSLLVPADAEMTRSPSKGEEGVEKKDRERERERDRDRAEGAHMTKGTKLHKHGHKAIEPSPRRQNSTPEMSSSPGGSSLKDSRDGSVSSLISADNSSKAAYERKIAELESLLDSSKRQSEKLEKALAHERAITAEMEVLLNAASDLRAASARFDAACKDLLLRKHSSNK